MKRRVLSLAIAVATIFLTAAHAQLDSTFGTNGVAPVSTAPGYDPLLMSVLPDGKIFTVSVPSWSGGSGAYRLFFARLNANGSPDTTYGTNGVMEIPVPGSLPNFGRVNGAARQADGKIIIVGTSDQSSGLIARYHEDGTLDTGFANGGIHRPFIPPTFNRTGLSSVLIQPDGKILVAGFTGSSFGSAVALSFFRYLANGTPDSTFGAGVGYVVTGVGVGPWGDRVAEFFTLQFDGKIIVGNRYQNGNGSPPISRIQRFNADGSFDNTFTVINFVGTSVGPLKAAALQTDNKILTGTEILKSETLERVHNDVLISRFNADGTPDATFGTGGQTSFDITNYQSDKPTGLQVMPDGQIVVVVAAEITRNRTIYRGGWFSFARLTTTGALNGKYLAAPSSFLTEKTISSLLPDGKLLTIGSGVSGLDVLRTTGVPLQSYVIHGIPFNFPSPASGADAKPSHYRPSNGTWLTYPSSGISAFGLPDDIPVPSDYINSFFSPEYAFFRPSNGTWYISRQVSGVVTDFLTVRWGLSGDIPVPADYDGDGKSDVAVFRPSNGVWYIRNSSDESYRFVQWGLSGDKPAVGDFDGDGKYDISVFRPSDGNWYIIRSSDGGFIFTHFGLDGDIPVQEDYDGDEKFDIAVYRPSTGIWYRLNSTDGSFFAYQWGLPGDIPVPADYDRDRKINIAVWRPSNGYWYIVNPDYASMHFYVHGNPTDIPLPGRF